MNTLTYNKIRAREAVKPANEKKHTWFIMQSIFLILLMAAFCLFSSSQNAWAGDHGDDMGHAETLALEDTMVQDGSGDWDNVSGGRDYDWYEFTVADGDVDFTFHRTEGRLIIRIRNNSGSTIKRYPTNNWWTSGNTIEDTLNMTAGTYYIQIINRRTWGGWSVGWLYPEFDVTVDQDITGATYYYDGDVDGYGDPDTPGIYNTPAEADAAGYVVDNTDCDDSSNLTYPGAVEICDNIDNDCDGSIDEGIAQTTYYRDDDDDGYGDATQTLSACSAPEHYVDQPGDCNDSDGSIHPGAFDVCDDGIDQDCSGSDRTCSASDVCADLADIPLETQIESAPPIVMLLLDDSGSMAWDVVCPENGGQFSGNSNVNYVEDAWKSQWAGYNGIYYNPLKYDITGSISSQYEPWPGGSFSDADMDNPKAHPLGKNWSHGYYNGGTYNMDATFENIDGVSVHISHYYVWSSIENAPYLVNLDESGGVYSADYYKVDAHGTQGWIDNLILDATPPSDVTVVDPAAERQNFANWFKYHRTRELVAKAALGNVITNSEGILVGIHTINESVTETVEPIHANGQDETARVLEDLYKVEADGGTPLRQGLEDVGQYLDADDGNSGNLGSAPWADSADGGTCQQAFVIMMTDGYYNGSNPSSSIGNADSDNGPPYADGYSRTLADVAMYYYENDLNNGYSNDVTLDDEFDTADHQHMVTYSVSFGLYGTINPESYPDCLAECSDPATCCPSWPSPNTDPRRIDDLWHASVNGRGDFYAATNALELAASLNEILSDVGQREGQGASVAVNTQTLEEETAMFQGTYNSGSGWSGNLYRYEIDSTTGEVAVNPTWAAKDELDNKIAGNGWDINRNIITYDSTDANPLLHGPTIFQYANLSPAMRDMLSTNATTSEKLVEYLRGNNNHDEDHPGGTFRVRPSLGDIVHSAPVHHGDYLYVGANDGMLHVFHADTGDESFAYIPGVVFENLKELANTSYEHKFFVDNTVYIETVGGVTYLVGALGRGGRGIYCIDISDPAAISEIAPIPDIWEYSAETAGDDDLGYTFSKVALVKSNSTNYPNVIIFGNGYDSVNGKAVLYIMSTDGTVVRKIDTGVGDAASNCNGLSTPALIDEDFDHDVDYLYAGDLLGNMWKFDLRSSNENDWHIAYEDGSGDPQPLFQAKDEGGQPQPITVKPAVLDHCNTEVDGDIVVFGTGKYMSTGDFDSEDVNTIYGIWDWKEEWLAQGDPESVAKLRYLGNLMPPSGGIRSLSNVNFTDVDTSLLAQVEADSGDIDGWRTLSTNEISWFSPEFYKSVSGDPVQYNAGDYGGHLGWYIDLIGTGERVIAKPIARTSATGDPRAIVVSLLPSSEPCSTGGTAMLHFTSACSGGGFDTPQFDYNNDGYINYEDMVIDWNNDGTIDSSDVATDTNNDGVIDANDVPAGVTINFAPTAKELGDIYYEPVILNNKERDTDELYFGPDQQETTESEAVGMVYWWMR